MTTWLDVHRLVSSMATRGGGRCGSATRACVFRSARRACTPADSSWLSRIGARFTALRHFTLDGTDHADRKEQGSMIRRYVIRRDRHADDRRLRAVVDRADGA